MRPYLHSLPPSWLGLGSRRSCGWLVLLLVPGLSAGVGHSQELLRLAWLPQAIEPESGGELSLRQALDRHLSLVDRSLTELRNDYRWRVAFAATSAAPQDDRHWKRLDAAGAFVHVARSDEFFTLLSEPLATLDGHLQQAKLCSVAIRDQRDLSEQELRDFQQSREYVKGLRYWLSICDSSDVAQVAEKKRAPSSSPDLRPHVDKLHPPMLVEPSLSEPTQRLVVEDPLSLVLCKLALLSTERRLEMMRRSIENETTRVVDIQAREPTAEGDGVYYVLVERRFELPEGERRVLLPFQQTVERINLGNAWQALQLLAGQNHEASLVIRNTLLTEVPVTPEFSISAYNTCLTYRVAPQSEAKGRTEITFTPEMELAFYQRNGRKVSDVVYRTAVRKRCETSLEETKTDVTTRTHDMLAELMGRRPAALDEDASPPAVAADTDSRTSPAGPTADVMP